VRQALGTIGPLAFANAGGLGGIEAHLDGEVSVSINGLDLQDCTGTSLYDGDRSYHAGIVIDLSHTNLFTQQGW